MCADAVQPPVPPGKPLEQNRHLLAAGELVLDFVYRTVAAVIEPAAYFEIVLADLSGEVVLSRATVPACCLYPAGSRLDAAFTAVESPCAFERFTAGGRPISCTVAPLAAGRQARSGLLAVLVEDRPPIAGETVEAWALLIANRSHLSLSVDKALTHNEQMLRIMNTIQDGFMAADRSGVVTFLNRAGEEIFGMDAKDIVGRHMVDAFKFEPQLLNVLATGVGWADREFHITLPHGRQLHLIKTAIPVFGDNNEVIGVIDTFRKFTKIQRLVNDLAGRSLLTFDDLIAESQAMKTAIAQARKAAANLSPVLLQGESGTGKEIFAQAIHKASDRADGPFIVIDCSAIPRELIESELFGYVEGAFTGGSKGGRPGKFELASGGTVLLDEIGEMPLDLQTRLLRVLQNRTVTRLGSAKTLPVDIMIIAATNKDLRREVMNRRFRADLFYRLNIVSISIPPLRARPVDVPVLARHFTRKIGLRMARPGVTPSPEALALLTGYYWPGNVRELENVIERAYNLLEGDSIDPPHLPDEIRFHAGAADGSAGHQPTLRLADAEKELILAALQRAGGNHTQAARLLGIARSTLYEKLRAHSFSSL
ncbi:MAG: sigma 54-interacting transcriptional regulator [Sporomusaceae bacterium]|nr:sigma 54-interacting transcriptional regulator [Sporomusaceae bacterium]